MNRLAGAELVVALNASFPELMPLESRFDTEIQVRKEDLVGLMDQLKTKYGYNYLAALTAVDNKTDFTVVYRVHSIPDNRQLVVKVNVDRKSPSLPTVRDIWGAADWQEREVYDLMGINFTGRSISRILLPEEFEGHPLRKDYQGGRQV